MLVYIYMLLTLVMGISALWKGAIYPGIAGIGPTLCWFAASSLKGSSHSIPRGADWLPPSDSCMVGRFVICDGPKERLHEWIAAEGSDDLPEFVLRRQ